MLSHIGENRHEKCVLLIWSHIRVPLEYLVCKHIDNFLYAHEAGFAKSFSS